MTYYLVCHYYPMWEEEATGEALFSTELKAEAYIKAQTDKAHRLIQPYELDPETSL
jgi:hypothetical protein